MKHFLPGFVLILSACAVQPPPVGTVERIEYDERKALIAGCMKSPERYGYPYTRAENADLALVDRSFSRNVYSFCNRVARIEVTRAESL